MEIFISKPKELDLELFSESSNTGKFEVRYGLPHEVRYCTKCVISNQRPNSAVEYLHDSSSHKKTINFDESGVCDACRFAERKNSEIDWDSKRDELQALCDANRSKAGNYDCIVPGSGGKDSVYASNVLRKEFGMHPLTVTWAPHMYTPWGWDNFQSWIHSGNDNSLFTPNGKVHRLLTRLAVENLLHPFQPFMIGQKLLAPMMAEQFGIPLVFYGENEAEYGNPIEDTSVAIRSPDFFSGNYALDAKLGGVSASDLIEQFDLEVVDLKPYLPMDTQQGANIQVHYLGYYLKWHPQGAYYYAVETAGFKPSPERTPGTYSRYNSIDDKIDDFHYYTTGVKFGIGRASYDSSQEIRSGDLTRDEAVKLVHKFDHEYPSRFMPELVDYLSISCDEFGRKVSRRFEVPVIDEPYLQKLTDGFRSPHLWRMDNNSSWRLRAQVR